MMPDAVHHDAGGERMRRLGEPPRQRKPPAGGGTARVIHLAENIATCLQNGGRSMLHSVTVAADNTAHEDMRIRCLALVPERLDDAVAALRFESVDLRGEFLFARGVLGLFGGGDLLFEFGDLLVQRRIFGVDLLALAQRDVGEEAVLRFLPGVHIERGLETGHEAVVVPLGEWVILVIVAAGAFHR